jgi:hypothetical protein
MSDPTTNHDLQRPEKGAQNWHVPLNENFSKIDSQVEIRDRRERINDYEPVEDAKFLATDTGEVFLGDGSAWQIIGNLSGTPGSVTATPGEVQDQIDRHASGHEWGAQPMQKISLVSGAVYRPTGTWKLKSGTRLDFNGAVVRPQGDFDVLELQRDTEVHNARINVADINNYSSSCIVVAASSGKIATQNPATVHDCHLFNDRKNGVGLQFKGTTNPVSIQRASGTIHNFDRGVEFRAEGSGNGSNDGWCNGNTFQGAINGARLPVYLNSVNGSPVSGNTVRAQIQCSSDTEWVVRQEDAQPETSLRGNSYFLQIWDGQNISNEFQASSNRNPPRSPIWYIGSGQQEYNSMRSLSGSHSTEFILNRSTTGRDRNAILNGIGSPASRGATDFSHPSTFATNSAPFHPDS